MDTGSTAAAAQAILDRIGMAAERAGRSPTDVQVIAVTKGFDGQIAVAALAAGLTQLGENRIQEAQQKIPAVMEHPRVAGAPPAARPTWHLIGHLQTNKAGLAARLFDWVHTVDSLRLAEALSARRRGGALPVLVQIKTSSEATKTGMTPAVALDEVPRIAALPQLEVRGLMTIPPNDPDPCVARDAFVRLRRLSEELAALRDPRVRMEHLSMGMSRDFEIAVEEGATMVRLGTALFGPRPPHR